MSSNALKEGAYFSAFLVALIVIVGGAQSYFVLPSEVTQPAQAISGGGCEKNANVSAAGGGINPGETVIVQPKGCPAFSCWQEAGGGMKCMQKIAAQGMAGGGGGMLSSLGQGLLSSLMQSLMGKGGGGGGGGDMPSGTGNVDYQYGTKPLCSDFVASSGQKPAETGASVFLSWARTGGQPESVTLTPSVGVATVESPVELKVPEKSTTYTLTVANRSGSSTCTTRVFVGPRGSAITNAEDLAFIATARGGDSASGQVGEQKAELSNPLGRSGYTDISKTTSDVKENTDATLGSGEQPHAGVVYGDNGPLIARGEVENGYVDKNAFQNDKNAFLVDDAAFVTEDIVGETAGSYGVHGSGDFDSLEAQMRELLAKKNTVHSVTATQGDVSVWGRPDVGVTGSLGIIEPSEEGVAGQEGQNQSLFGRLGDWVKSVFCFWCVGGQTQAGGVLLAQESGPLGGFIDTRGESSAKIQESRQKAEDEKKLRDALKGPDSTMPANDSEATLIARCKEQNESAKKKYCAKPGSADLIPDCVTKFDAYTEPRAIVPFEEKTFDKKNPDTNKAPSVKGGTGQCKKVSDADATCAKQCKEKGYDVIPKEAVSAGSGKIPWCNEKKRLACREKIDMKKGDGKGNGGAGCDKTKDPSCKSDKSGGGGGDTGGGGGGGQGGGGQGNGQGGGNGFADTKMGQGMGEGLGKGLADMLKGLGGGQGGGSGSGGGQPAQDPCTLMNAQYNPACNPSIPTTAPSCVPQPQQSSSLLSGIMSYFTDTSSNATDEALSVSSSVIYKGQTSTVQWMVYGKGHVTTVVNYVTTDENGAQLTGTLGVTDGTSGSKEVSPERSTTYTLKATNELGSVTCKPQRIAVRPKTAADDPQVATVTNAAISVTCSPESFVLGSGEQPTVEWGNCPAGTTATLGTSTEDGEFSTTGEPSGSVDVNPRRDSTYVVRCRNQYNEELGRGACRISVDDTQGGSAAAPSSTSRSSSRPSVEIFDGRDDPNTPVEYGESVRVEWRSKNVADCVVYGPGCKRFGRSSNKCFKEIGRSGFVVGNLYETSDFVAECRAADRRGTVSDELHIVVGGGASTTTDAPASADTSSPSPSSGGGGATLEELLGGME